MFESLFLVERKKILLSRSHFLMSDKPRWVPIECHLRKWVLVLKGLGTADVDQTPVKGTRGIGLFLFSGYRLILDTHGADLCISAQVCSFPFWMVKSTELWLEDLYMLKCSLAHHQAYS